MEVAPFGCRIVDRHGIDTPETYRQIAAEISTPSATMYRLIREMLWHNPNLTTLDVARLRRVTHSGVLRSLQPLVARGYLAVDALEAHEGLFDGRVYLIEAGGRYKIGYTANLDQRVAAIQSHSPFPARVVHAEGVDGARFREKELHRIFHQRRTHGEWFDLSPDDVSTAIQVMKSWHRRS